MIIIIIIIIIIIFLLLLLLNRTQSTEYSMKINKLGSQLARANVRKTSFSSSLDNKPDKVSELSRIIISSLRKATRSSVVS